MMEYVVVCLVFGFSDGFIGFSHGLVLSQGYFDNCTKSFFGPNKQKYKYIIICNPKSYHRMKERYLLVWFVNVGYLSNHVNLFSSLF